MTNFKGRGRWLAALAAGTGLMLTLSMAPPVAAGPVRGEELPLADLKLPPQAVAGSTPQRMAAWQGLTEQQRAKLPAAAAELASRVPAGLTAKANKPAEVVPAWQDVVAGKVDSPAPAGKPRYESKPLRDGAGTLGLTGVDADVDGLDDGFETDVSDAFTPVYHVSSGEQPGTGFARFADSTTQTVVQDLPPVPPVSHLRVQPLGFATDNWGQQVSVLRLDYLTLWNWDDGLDVGTACHVALETSLILAGLGPGISYILEGLQAHPIDNERSAVLVAAPVAAPWTFNQDPAAYAAYSFFTSGHEGTFTDTSAYFVPDQPVPAGLHINLALSRQKHATYTFNPNYLPLLPAWVIAASYAAIDFLYYNYYIDWYQYLVYLAAADSAYFACFVERFSDQGGFFADPRINVGEPHQPINQSAFILDPDLLPKLTTPLW